MKFSIFLSIFTSFICIQSKAEGIITKIECLDGFGYYGYLRVAVSPAGKNVKVDSMLGFGISLAEQLGLGKNTNLHLSFKSTDCSLNQELSSCKGKAKVKFYNLGFYLEKLLDSTLTITPSPEGHIATITLKANGVLAKQTTHFRKNERLSHEGCLF